MSRIPSSQTPFIDSNTGLVSQEWFRYLQGQSATGNNENDSLVLSALSPPSGVPGFADMHGGFLAYQTGAQLIPNAIGTLATFNVVANDEDGGWNAGTNQYFCTRTGVYTIAAGFGYAAAVVVAAKQITISISDQFGVLWASSAIHSSNLTDIVAACSIAGIKLNAGQGIQVNTFHNFGAASNSFGNRYSNWFSLVRHS